jgi:GH43 family beta-xylosidase
MKRSASFPLVIQSLRPVSAQHADGRIHAREGLDAEDAVKERRAASAEGVGDFDPHDAEIEQFIDEVARNLGVLVHVPDVRPDLPIREFVNTVPKQGFVFR